MVPRKEPLPLPFPALPCWIFQYLIFESAFSSHARTHARTPSSSSKRMSSRVPSTCLEDNPLENRDLSKFVSCPQGWSRFFSFGSLLYSCRLRQAWGTEEEVVFFFFFRLRSVTSCDNFVRTSHCGGHEIHVAHLECVSTPVTRREHTRPKHRSFSP